MSSHKEKVQGLLSGGKKLVEEAWQEAHIQHDAQIASSASAEAANKVKDEMIKSAINAFIELNADNETIYELLDKHFKVNTTHEIIEYTKYQRISSQIEKLRKYKYNQGMTSQEFRDYSIKIGLYNRLRNEKQLRTLPVEKLAAALEK